ncbi:MAG TPA: transposase [Methylomirabilota bacterium]|nr:transposase [Methylomirabilota bacterium]
MSQSLGIVDDRHPVPKLAKSLVGKLFGDKGYLSQPLAQHLLVTQGLQLITKLLKNKHNRLLDWPDKLLLRKSAIIESLAEQLKKTFRRLNAPAIAGRSISWSISSLASSRTAINRKSLRSGCNSPPSSRASLSRTHVIKVSL